MYLWSDTTKTLFAIILINTIAYGIVKVSVIAFYKRLFSVGGFKFYANALTAIVTAWTLAGLLGTLFAARPLSNFWLGNFAINWGIFNTAMAALDLLLDVVILLLPLIAIRELQVSFHQKISIMGLFWLGFMYASTV